MRIADDAREIAARLVDGTIGDVGRSHKQFISTGHGTFRLATSNQSGQLDGGGGPRTDGRRDDPPVRAEGDDRVVRPGTGSTSKLATSGSSVTCGPGTTRDRKDLGRRGRPRAHPRLEGRALQARAGRLSRQREAVDDTRRR